MNVELVLEADSHEFSNVYIEGPVGRLGSRFLNYRHVILVATGVGVTPYSSFLDWIQQTLESGKEIGIEQVHFIWLLRDQVALEWFGVVTTALQVSYKVTI